MDKELFNDYMKQCGLKNKAALARLIGENIYAVQRWGVNDKPFPTWLETWFKKYLEFSKASSTKDLKEIQKMRENINRQFAGLQAFQLHYKALKSENSILKQNLDKLQKQYQNLLKEHKEIKKKMKYINKVFDKQ